jgi:hypothetical protein
MVPMKTKESRPLWIYFLAVGDDVIKIGKSRQSRGARLSQHKAPSLDGHIPDVQELCEIRAASDADELAIHRHFADIRIQTETFQASEKLVGYIRWLRDLSYVVVPEDDDTFRDSVPVMDSEHWMPSTEGRTKPRDSTVLPGFARHDLLPRRITIDDFYTNEVIIEAAREAMGSIDTDPASHFIANQVVKAATFYTLATNGLTQHWHGNVWVNPPFSDWASWASKIARELASGRVRSMCALAATRTITAKYFTPLMDTANAICFTRGRIKFWGTRAGTPDDGHAILYFGPDRQSFCDAFQRSVGSVFIATSTKSIQSLVRHRESVLADASPGPPHS